MDNLFKETLAKVQAKILEEGSIRSFAQRLDMNPTTISRWFAEQRSPDFQSLCIILEYFNARIVFPGDPSGGDKQGDSPRPDTRPPNLSRQLAQMSRENAELRQQLDLMRTERDMARGQAQALKEQIERLAPSSEKSSYGNSTASGGNVGITKTA